MRAMCRWRGKPGASSRETLRDLMAAEDEWVTWPKAAAMVGCPIPTIDWYTQVGRIEKGTFRGRRPTLKRTSVVEFASWRRDRQADRQRRHRQRLEAKAAGIPSPSRPPRPDG
jgi:hypothetical protein